MKRSISGSAKRSVRPGGPNRPGPPTDFIALGQKSKNEPQRPIPEPAISMKKHATFLGASTSATHEARMSPTIPEPSVKYLDSQPNELFKRVTEAINDQDMVDGLICGAIRNLRANRVKPDQIIVVTLMLLAKKHSSLFQSEAVVECLVGLLKKDVGLDYIKSKGNSASAVLACNLLLAGFEQSFNWPSILVKVFIEDSLGDRIWVDHPECHRFVKAVCTAFDTIPAPKEHKGDTGEDSDKKDHEDDVEDEKEECKRFTLTAEVVRVYAIDMVRERVTRRQGTISAQDPTGAASGRHLLKTLTHMCGMSEVRLLAAHKLEMWIQNPKLTKGTQDLLLSICINCRKHNQDDVDTIGLLTRMRLKTKALLNHYIQGLKELIDGHKDSISTLFSYIVYNELSNARNPTNMSVIASLLQHKPKVAAETLATVCQDLLMQQEDYLRAVRALIREIVRIAKHDVDFHSFALGIMKEPDHEKYSRLDQAHKERHVASTADLICLLMLVSTSPAVKEAIPIVTKNLLSAEDHCGCYHKHKLDLATMQGDAVWWLHATVIPLLLPKMNAHEFGQLIHKLLFLKPTENYYMKDNWPPESERVMLVRHCSDVPILEDTIMRLAVIGLSHEHPLAPAETLDLIGQLVRRAGNLGRPDFNPISVERRDVIDTLLSLSQYHHPENIKLPSDYVPPSLAISLLYWTVWRTLLVILSFNTGTLGLQAWAEYPMLRSFMEMAIVNNFSFPLATVIDENERSQIINKEMQMVEVEKNEIIVFESHLAAATTHLAVTEESSLLLSQLIAMHTKGPPRRPPENVLQKTQALCMQTHIGARLCRSRSPDFLLDIINRHREDEAMPWLSGLVSSAKGDMSMLPVQCLCEYLMSNEVKSVQENEVVQRLRYNIHGGQTEDSMQVVAYFLRRLQSPLYETRLRAKRAFRLVLATDSEGMEVDRSVSVPASLASYTWVLHGLTSLPCFDIMQSKILNCLLEAVVRESEVVAISAYVALLSGDLDRRDLAAANIADDKIQYVSKLALALAHLLIDRQELIRNAMKSSLTNRTEIADTNKTATRILVESLLKIFLCHLKITKKHGKEENNESTLEEIPWRDTQDEIFLKWPRGGGTAQLHILVSQAMILLLTFGPPAGLCSHDSPEMDQDDSYIKMLYTWFDEDGSTIPKAYLMDTQEEALVLPDWLRLRLLHCEVTEMTSRLSVAAARDLEIEQLLLFVQSFGIPYIAMDQLLNSLDEHCTSSPELVARLTKDNKSYLARLVEGQWKRGCCNGTNFHALVTMEVSPKRASVIHSALGVISDVVDLTEDQSEESDIVMISSPEKSVLGNDERYLVSPMEADTAAGVLQDLFMSGVECNKMPKTKAKFRSLIRTLTKGSSEDIFACAVQLNAFTTAKKTGAAFVTGLYSNTQWSCSLLRIIDSRLKKCVKNQGMRMSAEKTSQMFQNVMLAISSKAPCDVSLLNPLALLIQSFTSSEKVTLKKSTDELGQLDWARLEEFLRKQLAFLEQDDEIKAKVALVAQILLEEIGSRKAKASRGKTDVQGDKFYASIGTTGLLIDWLQLLDPELLAHRPKLQRKLLFESQRLAPAAMPIKMSAKKGNLRSQYVTSHQTYLLSLLTEHSNWETVHKCLQWLLSNATCDPLTEKTTKSQSSAINVDARTAMDFLWVCMQTSKIWKGRENKSSSLQEPVFYLDSDQFCKVVCYMVAASTKQTVMSTKSGWSEASYFALFLVFYTKFGQKETRSENLTSTVRFIYRKALEQGVDMWWQLLAQLYILEPFHDIWDESTAADGGKVMQKNSTLAKIVTSSEVGSICRMDAMIQMLLDRIGYVKETGRVDTRDSVVAIQSSIDAAYDASLLLKKLASCRPAVVLRQLSLMLVALSGRTWYEFREFKAKNHLLFMSQLMGILEAVGPQLFSNEYESDVGKIFNTYFQMIFNYCTKARRQMKEVMFGTLKLVLTFLQKAPRRAYQIVNPYMHVLQGLMDATYNDHDYIVAVIEKIMQACESASFAAGTQDGEDGSLTIDLESGHESKDNIAPYLKMVSKNQDLESIAQVLSDISDTGRRKNRDLLPFLPHLTRLFTTCRDSSIRHSALNATVMCGRANPSCAISHIVPAYIACLAGSKPVCSDEQNMNGASRSLVLDAELATTVAAEGDEIARSALDFLPDIVVLCREKSSEILQAAFECGSRFGVGVQPPGTSGVLGTPLAIGGNSTWNDLSELLAKSLTLLTGLDQRNVKTATNGQT